MGILWLCAGIGPLQLGVVLVSYNVSVCFSITLLFVIRKTLVLNYIRHTLNLNNAVIEFDIIRYFVCRLLKDCSYFVIILLVEFWCIPIYCDISQRTVYQDLINQCDRPWISHSKTWWADVYDKIDFHCFHRFSWEKNTLNLYMSHAMVTKI